MQIYIDIKSCFHRGRVSTAESSTHCSHTWKLVSFSTGAPAWLTDRELPSKEGSPLTASSSSTQDRLQRVRRRETRRRVGSADPTRDSTNFQFPFHCAGVLVCGAAGRPMWLYPVPDTYRHCPAQSLMYSSCKLFSPAVLHGSVCNKC